MAKNKNKPNPNAIKSLTNQVQALNAKLKASKAARQPKPAKKGKKEKKKGQRNIIGGLTSFARANLDPFSVRGARVPDSTLLRSGTSYSRVIAGSGAPSSNYTTTKAFVSITAAPLFNQNCRPLQVWSTPDPTVSWFNFASNASPSTADYTKNWGSIFQGFDQGNPSTFQDYRVSGGGFRLKFFNIVNTNPVDVYCVPMFNGNTTIATWGNLVPQRTKHYRLDSGDARITLAYPVRHITDAYDWVANGKTGTAAADYPVNDGISGSVLQSSRVVTASTDCTSTNSGVLAWSLQSGMGGWQVAFTLPPGVSWMAEAITHVEYLREGTTPDAYNAESSSKLCYSNEQELEAVCNIISTTCQQEKTLKGGNDSPLSEFIETARNQTMNGFMRVLKESRVFEEAAAEGARYVLYG